MAKKQRLSDFPVAAALTIAGSDSCGGAGIQADLKTFEAFGVFGASALTAITAQNTAGVRNVEMQPAAIVADQIRACFEDLPIGAIKTGMLANADIVETVVALLEETHNQAPAGGKIPALVVDPVMIATSGARLLDDDAI
ncbi:MAG: bifunctional hydroxymethylpyrimidine kinase/phosphomethylpyrimidine kinase, partial [Wenzhouxiangellaceae bacterium]